MQTLHCKVVKTHNHFTNKFIGTKVTVKSIDRVGYGYSRPHVNCILDEDPVPPVGDLKKGDHFWAVDTEALEPIDVTIPDSHNGSLMLRQIWTFHEASHDAWDRSPPTDPQRYEDLYGTPWKDVRKFDVTERHLNSPVE